MTPLPTVISQRKRIQEYCDKRVKLTNLLLVSYDETSDKFEHSFPNILYCQLAWLIKYKISSSWHFGALNFLYLCDKNVYVSPESLKLFHLNKNDCLLNRWVFGMLRKDKVVFVFALGTFFYELRYVFQEGLNDFFKYTVRRLCLNCTEIKAVVEKVNDDNPPSYILHCPVFWSSGVFLVFLF